MSPSLTSVNDEVLAEYTRVLQDKYPNAIVAVIFYGSCLRTKQYQNSVLDFYVVVDKYRNAYKKILPSVLNSMLAPNVYFLQIELKGIEYQAKYAVVSYSDLDRYTSAKAFHSYFWARFTQPIALVYVQNDGVRDWLEKIQMQAAKTLYQNVKCMLPKNVSSKEFWIQALQLTYAAELRTESKDRAGLLYDENRSYFDELATTLDLSSTITPKTKAGDFICRTKWRVRIVIGKGLSVLRLLKATTTFIDGIDYIAWKIHRHTGEKIQVTRRLRKFPWIFCWPLLWRLYRSGKVR